MQIDFQFSTGWIAIFISLFVIIMVLQLALVLRHNKTSTRRKAVKTALNIFFFLSLILLLIQPHFYRDYTPQNILVHETDVSQDFLNNIMDSLNLDDIIPIEAYERSADNVYLAGQHFTPMQLGKLQRANVTWIPYRAEAAITDLRWNGLLRHGQSQTVYGSYQAEEEVLLSLRFGDEILDSVLVGPSNSAFRLTAQVKAIGRNQLTLMANELPIGQIRFFVTENDHIHYKMLFSYPDMEIRRLAEWLGKKGQGLSATVQTSTAVIKQSTNVERNDTLQFIITEPAFAGSTEVGEAIASGATVLFTNFSNIDRELLQINRALGTDWSVNRSHTEGNRTIEGLLTALPYRILTQPHQWEHLDAAVAFQRIGQAKVGVSLLEATFPIALQGDSLGYAAVWDRILFAMRPSEGTTYHIPQPTFSGHKSGEWTINSHQHIDELFVIGSDSIYLSPSSINPRSYTGYYHAPSSGWKALSDTLEIYFHGENNEFKLVRHENQIKQFIQYHQKRHSSKDPIYKKVKLSDWWWFALVLLSASLLWLEPRVGR